MAKFEHIDTIPLTGQVTLRAANLPELVHLDDPAFAVMTDFSKFPPACVAADESMDDALNELKVRSVHFLLVKEEEDILGIITSEDLLSEKPIKILQERRIPRNKITVKMLMIEMKDIAAFPLKAIRYARVGNVVETLKSINQHYALVIDDEQPGACLCGMFSTWQISRQLHHDIADSITKAQSVSELQHRHSK